MLISVHIPKTAGQTFRRALLGHFGLSLLLDYEHPFFKSAGAKNLFASLEDRVNAFRSFKGVECIHGHFLALKYARLADRTSGKYIMWMRDPVERLGSHYNHCKRKGIKGKSGMDDHLHTRIVKEGWTLERFCLEPYLKNYYSQFLWNFPIERFDFIGVTEHYEEDVHYLFSRVLGEDKVFVPDHKVNANKDRTGSGSYVEDPDLRKRIEAFHDQDMRLYRMVLEKRRQRMAEAR